jgi:RNA polymerase sigma-70 factor (ECF subfamily)
MTEETLESLYGRNRAGLRRYVARLVGEADAEDVTHDVFERAQRAWSGYRGEARLSTWLYRIATHAALDRLRSGAFRQRRLAEDASKVSEEDTDDRPDAALARADMRRCILGIVEQLPPSQRAVVLLGELGGLPDAEVGEALGISVGAAKVRLHRARAALRRLLTCACTLYRDDRNELACEPVEAASLRVIG